MARRVLFLCTGNSCRSQMAEGLLRALARGRFEAYSAGTEPAGLNPTAVAVMRELGIDIGRQTSTSVEAFRGEPFDYVVTVCDRAREACPTVPAGRAALHWSFDDPAAAEGDERDREAVFRRVRDEIAERIKRFLEDED